MSFLDSFSPRCFRPNRWHLLFLILLVICGVAFSIQLSYMSSVWDETVRLLGGYIIYQGALGDYLTFTRYPPLMDFVTAGYFYVFGVNIFSARMVSVTFSLLTLVAVFGLASKAYGNKVALVSCAVLATMPGFIFMSRVALLDVPILFFFTATIFLFLSWLYSGKNISIILCGLMLGVAILAKYQAVIAGLTILITLPLLFYRNSFRAKISRFPLLLISASFIIIPTFVWIYSSGIFGQWLGMLQSSDTLTNAYGARFPLPIFYMLETTVPFDYMHPIYLPVFVLGLLGFGFLIWRRKPEDKLLLVWFVVVYVFFTFVGVRSWRYVMPLFPVVAISAANLIVFLSSKLVNIGKCAQTSSNKRGVSKLSAGILTTFIVAVLFAGVVDAYNWIENDSEHVQLPEAVHYIANGLKDANESVLVVCGVNLVNQKGTEFFLKAYESKSNKVLLYPLEPADAYTPEFNVSRMTEICKAENVKYLILFENKGETYYNCSINAGTIGETMLNSSKVYYDATLGGKPDRVFIFRANTTAINLAIPG